MDDRKRKGYTWAISAGFCAAMAAISAKLSTLQFLRYGLVVVFNVVMWACYVNSLKALSSLQATVTNFATNFISSGLAGFFLFQEAVSYKQLHLVFAFFMWLAIALPNYVEQRIQPIGFDTRWVAGALLIVIGVVILSKSGIEKARTD